MVEVNLWSGLRQYADGKTTIEVDATNVGDVLKRIVDLHPGLEPFIEAGVSVAVDGRIIANDLTEPVYPETEVYLLQQLKGG